MKVILGKVKNKLKEALKNLGGDGIQEEVVEVIYD